jgi:hypothetical protein
VIEIGRALVQMRRDTASLRGIALNGRDVTWRLDTDFDADESAMPRSVISIRIGASETLAGIPWTADEVVEVSDGGNDSALDIATRIATGLRGKVWYGDACAIQGHTLAAIESDSAAGAKNSVTLRWFGRASVRPR